MLFGLEYFWRFDKFLLGGQDFELSLLSILIALCMIWVAVKPSQDRRVS